MTEQSSNDQFHNSSFLQGHNAEYVERLHASYAKDPTSVDESWQAYFRSLGDTDTEASKAAEGPSWARADWPPVPKGDLTAALTGEWDEASPEQIG